MNLASFEESSNKQFFDSIVKPDLDQNFLDIDWKLSNEIGHFGKFNISGICKKITGYEIRLFYYVSWLQIQCQFEIITDYKNVSFRSEVFNSFSDCLKHLRKIYLKISILYHYQVNNNKNE